jgi:hypothetical protein
MTYSPLFKSLLLVVLIAAFTRECMAQEVHSFGLFTGITSPYTLDGGITKDPRYRNKYSVKFTPIGFHYGIDLDGYGFTIDPQISKMGQSFIIINTVGGHVGERKSNLTYLQVPAGIKLHMIDLSFFKVSFVASASVGFLLSGEETITHEDSKLYFPPEVYPSLPEDYTVVYDGVLVPNIRNKPIGKKNDFRSIQVFGAIGMRSDWDVNEDWRISFDIRGNYGLFEPRSRERIKQIENNQAIYDLEGNRRELFLSFNIGFARTIEISPRDKKKSNQVIPFKGKGKGKPKRKNGRN